MVKSKDLGTVDPIAAVSSKPEVYFGCKVVRSWMLASKLVEDALVLGVSPVTVVTQPGGWTTVAGSADWTAVGPGAELPTTDLFRYMIPFNEAGIEAFRHEILVTAFARDVFVVKKADVLTIKGEVDAALARAVASAWPFSINFHCP